MKNKKLIIDWDTLECEIHSIIAHASAGTNFNNPDLQMAVDECIVAIKFALGDEVNEK